MWLWAWIWMNRSKAIGESACENAVLIKGHIFFFLLDRPEKNCYQHEDGKNVMGKYHEENLLCFSYALWNIERLIRKCLLNQKTLSLITEISSLLYDFLLTVFAVKEK